MMFDILFIQIELAASQGDVSETTLLLEKAVHKFPQSESMWCLYIEYSALTEANITKAVGIFHRARKTLKKVNECTDVFE